MPTIRRTKRRQKRKQKGRPNHQTIGCTEPPHKAKLNQVGLNSMTEHQSHTGPLREAQQSSDRYRRNTCSEDFRSWIILWSHGLKFHARVHTKGPAHLLANQEARLPALETTPVVCNDAHVSIDHLKGGLTSSEACEPSSLAWQPYQTRSALHNYQVYSIRL